jgi:hypothetical protein
MIPKSNIDLLERPMTDELDTIQQAIRSNLALQIGNFRIRPFDNGLVLEGHTTTYHGKQMIQHSIMNLTDVPILANNITVG